ncbi:MAG TPA: phosphatase PAP2 family protein [Sphingomonas sp.]|jgi:membrane-associated phospholipid phosphatase|nr:phosphatase PAP2 family protein [Sphingomonas sp.]
MRPTRLTIVLSMLLAPTAAYASDKGWGTASDVGAYGLAAVALGLPLAKGDDKGALEAAFSLGAAEGATQILKAAIPETRPDGSNRKSFPSGHTALAFAGAATIQQREGWGAAIPAYAVAAFVGVARVEARKHHWYDCVAGAAIGETAGLLLTHHNHRDVALIPWGDSQGAGISLAARF